MGDEVSHSRDFTPWDVGVLFAQIVWQLLYCLAYDVEIVEDPVEPHLVGENLIPTEPRRCNP